MDGECASRCYFSSFCADGPSLSFFCWSRLEAANINSDKIIHTCCVYGGACYTEGGGFIKTRCVTDKDCENESVMWCLSSLEGHLASVLCSNLDFRLVTKWNFEIMCSNLHKHEGIEEKCKAKEPVTKWQFSVADSHSGCVYWKGRCVPMCLCACVCRWEYQQLDWGGSPGVPMSQQEKLGSRSSCWSNGYVYLHTFPHTESGERSSTSLPAPY